MNSSRFQANELWLSASEARSSAEAQSLLRRANILLLEADPSGSSTEVQVLRSGILTSLALELEPGAEHAAARRESCTCVEALVESPRACIAHAEAAINWYQDRTEHRSNRDRVSILRAAARSTDRGIRAVQDPRLKADLLSRRSSILRHLAGSMITRAEALRLLNESRRCASNALELHRGSGQLLECGLSIWSTGRRATTDKGYNATLTEAAALIIEAAEAGGTPAALTLVYFYRMVYRSLDSCLAFQDYVARYARRRDALRLAFLYAESAYGLWSARFPPELVHNHLLDAESLLNRAEAEGCGSLRHNVSCAYVQAALGNIDAGTALIRGVTRGGHINWDEAVELFRRSGNGTQLTNSFKDGIADSGVMSRIGTFYRAFLKDNETAEAFYRAAIRLDVDDPISLTNLARILLEKRDPESLMEARLQIERAKSFADRRFYWWRKVQDEIALQERVNTESKSVMSTSRRSSEIKNAPGRTYWKYVDLRKRLAEIETWSPQIRGVEFEKLVYNAASISFLDAKVNTRGAHLSGVGFEIDVSFYHESSAFLVECKWEKEPVGPEAVDQLFKLFEVSGQKGLLISMSGFKRGAIDQARAYAIKFPILLMDGVEISAIFRGELQFDTAIQKKLQYLQLEMKPYVRLLLERSDQLPDSDIAEELGLVSPVP